MRGIELSIVYHASGWFSHTFDEDKKYETLPHCHTVITLKPYSIAAFNSGVFFWVKQTVCPHSVLVY